MGENDGTIVSFFDKEGNAIADVEEFMKENPPVAEPASERTRARAGAGRAGGRSQKTGIFNEKGVEIKQPLRYKASKEAKGEPVTFMDKDGNAIDVIEDYMKTHGSGRADGKKKARIPTGVFNDEGEEIGQPKRYKELMEKKGKTVLFFDKEGDAID